MLADRISSAVVSGYSVRDDAPAELLRAEATRRWLEGLSFDPALRAGVVEVVAAVEAGLREAVRRRELPASRDRGQAEGDDG